VLRSSIHGDEIESVTVRLVSRSTITRFCGRVVSCYRFQWRDGGEILLPPRAGPELPFMLLHEYAHHLDVTYGLTESWRRGPSATRWWAARRIEQRLQASEVSWDYELGWQRSIGEILAEDYVQVHARTRYGIRWLPAPNRFVRTALRRDIRTALTRGR
jgi:hypothetical protein